MIPHDHPSEAPRPPGAASRSRGQSPIVPTSSPPPSPRAADRPAGGSSDPHRKGGSAGSTASDPSATLICSPDILETEGPLDPGSARPVYLIVIRGGVPGTMLRLVESEVTLGRSPENGLHFPEESISRHHASFAIRPDGQVSLTDQGSTNGTFVNDVRIPPRTPVGLQDGDRIRFGSSVTVKLAHPDPSDEDFQRKLYERSVRDPLTGLYNRGYFASQIGPLSAQSRAQGLGLALLMLDIDHFKKVNDTYGHDAGDTVLREVAEVLNQVTRPEDLVARHGGEEFVLALPLAGRRQAAELAERVRQTLAERKVDLGEHVLQITASIGVAFAPPDRPRPGDVLLTAADQAMYRAKVGGRDQVALETPPDPGNPGLLTVTDSDQ